MFSFQVRNLLLLSSLSAAFLLPKPSGKYGVALEVDSVTDTSRLDPWKMDIIPYRRLMISTFTPVPRKSCRHEEKIPYMPPLTAKTEDEILAPYDFPSGILPKAFMSFCAPRESYKPNTTFPLILFSPGLNTSRLFYSYMASELSSHGYKVITVDHPFETDVVEFLPPSPYPFTAYGGNVNTSDLVSINHALDIRMNDMTSLLNHFNISYEAGPKAAIMGDSFGGAAAAAAMLNDTRLRGGVNLDGFMYGPVLNAGLGRPGINQSFILWGSEGHNSSSDAGWNQFWKTVSGEGIWKRELKLKGSVHGSFWDLRAVVDAAGLRGKVGMYEADLMGELDGKRVVEVIGEYLRDYFGFVLEGKGEGLLKGPSRKFPEVEFVGY